MGSKFNDYTILEKIGNGSFGEVWKIRRRSDNKDLVWKIVHYAGMEANKRELLEREVLLLQKLNHPHIVHYDGLIEDAEKGVVYILMEFCSGGDLAHYIESFQHQKPLFVTNLYLHCILTFISLLFFA